MLKQIPLQNISKEVYVETAKHWHFIIVFHNKQKMRNNIGQTKSEEITKDKVKVYIKQLRNSSIALDNVHNRCLKIYTELLLKQLIDLFNQILIQGYIEKNVETGEHYSSIETKQTRTELIEL